MFLLPLLLTLPLQTADAAGSSRGAAAHSSIAHTGSQPSPTEPPAPATGADRTQPHGAAPSPQAPSGARRLGPSRSPSDPHVPLVTRSALQREVFGYAAASSLGDPNVGYPSWNFDLLSTVAFFAIRVTYNGVLVADSDWNVWDSSTLTGLVSTAHQHGVKVVMTLSPLYKDTVDFCDMLYNDDTTVVQVVNQVKLKGVDGVNIDYESQLAQCNPTNPALTPMTNQALLTRFAKDMRAGLDAAGPGYYLSIATYSGSALGPDGFFNIPDLNKYVDSFFVMAYDMDYANQGSPPLASCSSFCMAPVSPMANYYWNDSASMAQYSSVVGPGKTILGQPYYGRVACVSSPSAHATAVSYLQAATYLDAASAISSPDVQPGTYSTHRDGDDPAGQDRWDAWYDYAYGCWREMYWSDSTTLGVRYDLVNQDNLRGVGFWTLNYAGGAPELWNTLWTHFVACRSGGLSSNPGSPAPAGSVIAFTATSGGCLSPQYEYWIQYPNGAWYLKQGWGGPTFNWDTTGLTPGTYTVHAWVNRSGSAWETIGSETVTLTGCTTASLSPSSGTQPGGTIVNFTATSGGGCPNPVYEFWILYPNGAWYLKQGWGASASFNWDTTAVPAGTYTIHAWANQQGAAPTLEVYGSSTVTVTACGAAALGPFNPTAAAGSTVAFTASSSGCVPEYEFWVQYPSGAWYLKQGWGGAGFSWDTTGLAPGVYTVHAWVNRSGTTWEAIGSSTVTLTGCTSAAVSPATGSAKAGGSITFTASASGCPNPVYEFWLLDPSGQWHLMQPFGTGSSWTWSTAGWGRGTYTIHVWANNQGADTSRYETIGSATYSLT